MSKIKNIAKLEVKKFFKHPINTYNLSQRIFNQKGKLDMTHLLMTKLPYSLDFNFLDGIPIVISISSKSNMKDILIFHNSDINEFDINKYQFPVENTEKISKIDLKAFHDDYQISIKENINITSNKDLKIYSTKKNNFRTHHGFPLTILFFLFSII